MPRTFSSFVLFFSYSKQNMRKDTQKKKGRFRWWNMFVKQLDRFIYNHHFLLTLNSTKKKKKKERERHSFSLDCDTWRRRTKKSFLKSWWMHRKMSCFKIVQHFTPLHVSIFSTTRIFEFLLVLEPKVSFFSPLVDTQCSSSPTKCVTIGFIYISNTKNEIKWTNTKGFCWLSSITCPSSNVCLYNKVLGLLRGCRTQSTRGKQNKGIDLSDEKCAAHFPVFLA